MNHLAKWVMRLYPARWRKRYGEELDALICDAGADVRTVADLAKGGIRMQFSTWSFLKLAVVLGIAGMLAGLGFSLFIPSTYVATTELRLTGTDSVVPAFELLQTGLTTRAQLSSVINDPTLMLYRDRLGTEPLDDVIQQMHNNLSISLDDASKLSIRFVYPDREKAEAAVRILVASAPKVLNDARAPGKYPDYLDVLETATLPSRPLRPDAWITAACGFALALLVALPFRRTRRKLPVLLIVGVAAGTASAWFIPSLATRLPLDKILPLLYESHMTTFAPHANPATAADLVAEVANRSVMASIITDPRLMLYRNQQKTRDLSEIADTMLRDMSITTHKSAFAQMFDISFVYSDRFRAQQAVEAVATKMLEAYHKEVHPGAVTPAAPTNWGALPDAANPRIAVESIGPNREKPMLLGLALGLCLAAIIALVRRRWVLTDDEPAAAQPIRPARFSGSRFRKLAFSLTGAGVLIGAGVAIATPERYVSETSFILRNTDRWSAATLTTQAIDRAERKSARDPGLDPAIAYRGLTWHEAASVDGQFQRFEMHFVSDRPRRAWAVLEDLLGAIDQSVSSQRATEDSPYETVRGVDGALLTIPSEHYARPESSTVSSSHSRYDMVESFSGTMISRPEQMGPLPAPVASESESSQAGVPATEHPHEDSIAFDDERAKPVFQSASRILMEVIDPPSVPTSPQGPGWWTIAIGAAAGFVLAMLITIGGRVFGNLRPAQTAAPNCY